MKKLLYIILILPLWVNAQTNGTIQKTSATGTIRGSFGSLGLDTLTRVTGALVNGYILKYNASTNKWYASPDPTYPGLQDSLTKKANRTFDNVASGAIAKAKADTSATGLQTVSNFFPKGDTRYQRLSNQLNGTGIVEMSGTSVSYLSSTGTGNVVKAVSPTLTTPNIGNATGGTLNLSGKITSTLGNNTELFNSASATTGYQFGRMTNTSGGLLWGIEGSAAGTLLTGGSAYAGMLTTTTTKNLELGTDQTVGLKIDGTNRKVTIPELGGAGDVIVGANNSGDLGEIAIGSGLSLTAGVLTATGGSSGSVTTSGGTAGKITKFTSASNVENSIMTESSGLIDVTGDLTANIVTSDVGHKYNFGAANRGGIYSYSYLSGSGTNYSPTYFSESGLGVNFFVDGGLTKGLSINSAGDATFSGSISSPDEIPFVLSSPTTVDFHQSGAGTVRFVNDAFSSVNMSLNNSGDMGVRGTLSVTGAISGSNLSGTNTGDQTTVTGNAGTATALQTARNIQGVSFNGTADINPINGTGFVKASGTTLSYDNNTYLTTSSASSTYAPIASPTFTGTISGITAAMVGAPSSTGTGASGTWGINVTGNAATVTTNANLTGVVTSTGNATAIADAALSIAKTSGLQSALDAKAPLASPALTGNPTAPTQTAGDNSTKIATTAYVDATATTGSGASKQSAVIFTDVNSSSGGAIDLAQHTISTATNGDKISFEYTGNFAANTNSKPQMILTVDGTDFTIPSITPGNNEDWIISGSIIRVSSTIYKISINYFQSGQNNYPQVTSGATLDTNSLVITLTAPTTIANNDIVLSTASIQKFNAP